ncbi:MAG TPA: alpha/beta hydrolase [Candidatus Methylomirabilis sp.]|nr:alpha/beta hydrolase [Candidatus Methylomirabilis sp.]
MLKRWLKIALKSLTVLIALVLVAGIVYEQIGRRRDRARFPQIGRSVDIGGRTLNVFCSGAGAPPVIFESGGPGPGLEWEAFQREAAKFTQACWYDRAGEGWSDLGSFPRTSMAIANDLHELLKRAGVPPPYVFAGASFGGLNSRVYGGLYPNEVAGMILIDSAHEDELRRAPKFFLGRTAPRFLWHPLQLAFEAAAFVGLVRLTQSSPAQGKDPSQMTREEIIEALRQRPKSFVGNVSAGIVLPESFAEGSSVTRIGDFPLIVLTAGQSLDFGNAELDREAGAYQQVWIHEIQPKLVSLSTRGRQIVVPNANHGTIPQELIISSIREVVTEVRGGAATH